MEQKKLLELDAELDLREEEIRDKGLDANYDIGAQLRRWLSTAIKSSPLSRYEISARLSELIGREITKFQLDSWTAESKEGYHTPAEYMPALAFILNDIGGLRILAAPLGIKLLENKDLMWLEYGKVRQMERQLRLKKKQLEKCLQGAKK